MSQLQLHQLKSVMRSKGYAVPNDETQQTFEYCRKAVNSKKGILSKRCFGTGNIKYINQSAFAAALIKSGVDGLPGQNGDHGRIVLEAVNGCTNAGISRLESEISNAVKQLQTELNLEHPSLASDDFEDPLDEDEDVKNVRQMFQGINIDDQKKPTGPSQRCGTNYAKEQGLKIIMGPNFGSMSSQDRLNLLKRMQPPQIQRQVRVKSFEVFFDYDHQEFVCKIQIYTHVKIRPPSVIGALMMQALKEMHLFELYDHLSTKTIQKFGYEYRCQLQFNHRALFDDSVQALPSNFLFIRIVSEPVELKQVSLNRELIQNVIDHKKTLGWFNEVQLQNLGEFVWQITDPSTDLHSTHKVNYCVECESFQPTECSFNTSCCGALICYSCKQELVNKVQQSAYLKSLMCPQCGKEFVDSTNNSQGARSRRNLQNVYPNSYPFRAADIQPNLWGLGLGGQIPSGMSNSISANHHAPPQRQNTNPAQPANPILQSQPADGGRGLNHDQVQNQEAISQSDQQITSQVGNPTVSRLATVEEISGMESVDSVTGTLRNQLDSRTTQNKPVENKTAPTEQQKQMAKEVARSYFNSYVKTGVSLVPQEDLLQISGGKQVADLAQKEYQAFQHSHISTTKMIASQQNTFQVLKGNANQVEGGDDQREEINETQPDDSMIQFQDASSLSFETSVTSIKMKAGPGKKESYLNMTPNQLTRKRTPGAPPNKLSQRSSSISKGGKQAFYNLRKTVYRQKKAHLQSENE